MSLPPNLNLEKFLPSREKARQGVWAEIFPGIKFKLAFAGASNPLFKQATIKLAFDRKSDERFDDLAGFLNKDDLEKIPLIYTEAVVKGWTGIKDEEGKLLDYTNDNVVELFKQYPEVLEKIIKFATNEKNFSLDTESKDQLKKNP